MKHLKQRLIAATAMLMVSAVMLTSVSYAWFTMSTNPEVKGMTATVTANENLEIALDNWYYAGEVANKPADADDAQISVDEASIYNNQPGVQGSTVDNPYTWGNLVDLTKAFDYLNNVGEANAVSDLNIQPMKFVAKGEMVPNEEYVVPNKVVYATGQMLDDAEPANIWTAEADGTYTLILPDESDTTKGTKYTYTPSAVENKVQSVSVTWNETNSAWENEENAMAATVMVENPEYKAAAPGTLTESSGTYTDTKNRVWTKADNGYVYTRTDDNGVKWEFTDNTEGTDDVLKKNGVAIDAKIEADVTFTEMAVDATQKKDEAGKTWVTADDGATFVRYESEAVPADGAETIKYTYTTTDGKLEKIAVVAEAVEGSSPTTYKWQEKAGAEKETIAAEIAAPTSLLQYPEYSADGRVNLLKNAAATLVSALPDKLSNPAYKDGELDLTKLETQEGVKGGVKAYSATSGIPNYYAFSVDYWIRSNVAGNVYLSKDAALRANDETTADTLDDDKDYSEVVNTVKGEGSYIKIPGENYGVVKYELDSANNKLIPKYTDEQLAINAYIENLVVKFAYSAGEKDYSVAAAFAEKSEYISGDNLGKIQPMLQNDFATVAEGETTPTFDTALLQKKVTPEGGSEITYYYLNATSVDEKGVATAKAAEACADLYIYLDNATEMVANPDYVENGTEPEEIEEKIPVVALERNKGQKVTMYVYLDGETVSNADALLSDLGGLQFNIQFTHETIGAGTETDGGAQPVDPRPTVTTP